MAVVALIGLGLMVWGFASYNSLRKRWAGIIGPGGSYLALMGIMCLVMLIAGLVRKIGGAPSGAESAGEVFMLIAIMILGLGYTAFVMLVRCQTAKQRILLPFVACIMAAGFIWRLIAALVFHMPMENGAAEGFAFPQFIYDGENNPWQLVNNGGDNATYYCQKTGDQTTVYASDFDEGSPNGFYQK